MDPDQGPRMKAFSVRGTWERVTLRRRSWLGLEERESRDGGEGEGRNRRRRKGRGGVSMGGMCLKQGSLDRVCLKEGSARSIVVIYTTCQRQESPGREEARGGGAPVQATQGFWLEEGTSPKGGFNSRNDGPRGAPRDIETTRTRAAVGHSMSRVIKKKASHGKEKIDPRGRPQRGGREGMGEMCEPPPKRDRRGETRRESFSRMGESLFP